MGNQSSQLEKPDYLDHSEHSAQANYIRGASNNSQDTDSQPYHLNPSRFAFSSQAPQSTDPLAQLSRRRTSNPKPEPDSDASANLASESVGPSTSKSPVFKFEGAESPRDSPEHSQSRQPRISKRQRRTQEHSSPTSGAHLSGTQMNSFTAQAHDLGSPSLGAYSQGEQFDQADQHDAYDNLPVPSSEKTKRRRKEKKKKQRSQMDETQTLEPDSNHNHYPPIENPEYSLPDDHDTAGQDFEAPKSSKKRKRKSKHREAAQDPNYIDGYEAETGLDQLPQADELTGHTSLTNDPSSYNDPMLTTGASSQKRKSKGQGKKEHKKRKRDHGDSPNDLNGISQERYEDNVDQDMDDFVESGEEPTRRWEKEADVDNSQSAEHSFGDLAQSIYADHVKSQNSQPDNSGNASPDQDNDNEPSGVPSDVSPNEGIDEGLDEDDIGNIKADIDNEGSDSEVHKFENGVNSSEANSPEASEYSDDEAAKYVTRSDSSSAENFDQHSEDLGLDDGSGLATADGTDVLDDDHASEGTSSSSVADNQVEVSSSVAVQSDGLPVTDPAQHSQTKSSAGGKRGPKPTIYDHVTEEDVAELPSPAAAAASRKGGGGRPPRKRPNRSSDTMAGPSNAAPNGKSMQSKITSMLEGGPPSSDKLVTPGPKSDKSSKQTGPFSQFELRNINEAVQRWQENHKMTDQERNELIHGNPREVNSTDFWDSVHATCPNRIRQKVINQCRRKYHNFVARASWTPEQHEELSEMYELHGPKYTVIGKLINRHPEDVRDRIRNYIVCGKNMRKNAWSREEESHLTDIVNEALDHVKQLQHTGGCPVDSRPEDLVDWQLVSEKMDHTRSRLQCQNKWKLLKSQVEGKSIDGGDILSVDELITKAREEAEAMTSRERYNLTKAILACGANADSRIPWTKIRAQRPGYASSGKKLSRPPLMVAWHRMKLTMEDWKTLSVPEIAKFLCSQYKSTKTLEYANLQPAQLDAEYKDMEHKFGKLLKSPGTNKASNAKTPHFAVKSDDEESATGGSEDAAITSGSNEEASRNDRGGSADLGFDTELVKDDSDEASEAEVEDSEPEVKPQKSRKGRTSNNAQATNTSTRSDGDVTTPSKKGNGSKVEEVEIEEDAPANSAKKILARRRAARRRRPQPPAPAATESDEQSSDTNASEVESIPAHRPE